MLLEVGEETVGDRAVSGQHHHVLGVGLLGRAGEIVAAGDDRRPWRGGIDDDETPLQAVKREILEETGVALRDEWLEAMPAIPPGQSEKVLRDTGERVLIKMKFSNFRAVLPEDASDMAVQAGDDFTDIKWAAVDELPDLRLSDPTAASLRSIDYLK